MERSPASHINKLRKLTGSKFLFVLSLLSGICALSAVVILTYVSWGALTFNAASFQSVVAPYLNSTNSTLSNFIGFVEQVNTLTADSLYLLLPLLGIAGAFMLLTAFYLKSKSAKTLTQGVLFSFVFSLFVFLGILFYLPFSPGTVGFLFAYLGSMNGAGLIAAYALFLAYVVLGMLCGVFGLYRLVLIEKGQ
ncbi:MAG: hypothetical protein M1348_01960 [Candidatus Parvarchaeota archaeon]|nr:hypothetical protein [Candidatus Parvarchaeota archaeon]MCL5101354.1 hypothetical protein [Candidatus Parvarchaeota archaeon]